jgi:hypothetical protein
VNRDTWAANTGSDWHFLEAQPANRFAIPPGFRSFDPRALIERVKHSDAWVDP